MDQVNTRHRVAAAALLIALTATGCITLDFPGGPPDPLVETRVHGTRGPKILMLQIDGVIRETPDQTSIFGMTAESMVARVREELDRARAKGDIRALLLRINSPGGTVTASDMIYEEIRRFKEETGVPVIAQFMGMAASGGYYIAMAADEIIAQPTSVTGSIGVIFMGVNLSGLMEKIGVENQTLVTGSYKDAGSALREMKPEEREQLLSVLDDMFTRFKGVVGEGRKNLTAEEIVTLADGRIYSAPQALEKGLVDQIGDLREAIRLAERKAGLDRSQVVTYHRPRQYRKNLYTQAPIVPSEIRLELLPRWPGIRRPAFLYLWAPSAY